MGRLTEFFLADHRRLDKLLNAANAADHVLLEPFGEFRAGILRHIGIEEKVLIPAARAARDGQAVPIARRLRLDHGAIVLLLVPTPTKRIIARLVALLGPHNEAEEAPGGLYATCDDLLSDRVDALLEQIEAYPAVPLAPYQDSVLVERMIDEAIRKAEEAR